MYVKGSWINAYGSHICHLWTKCPARNQITGRLAFKNSIEHLDWIDNKSKELISEKSNAMKAMVGLPDWMLEADKLDDFYAGLSFSKTSHFQNLMNFHLWEMSRKLRTMHLVDDVDWPVESTDVNAFQWREHNQICMFFMRSISNWIRY